MVNEYFQKGFTLLFLLICSQFTFAQSGETELQGLIFNAEGAPLQYANVSVRRKGETILLTYQNLINTNKFNISINISNADSIEVEVSHIGYSSQKTTLLVVPDNQYRLQFNLMHNFSELEPVTVTTAPVWQRGDTTFFNVSAHKDGDEKKLQEILPRLPGFKINERGEIFFKGKKVEKIKIDGEELFANDPELLAKTFPIHVIKNLQAIENQSRNELLKGLEAGELVVLNIDLANNILMSLFGNAEAGLGTSGRYQFNPVAFSLAKQLRAGLILNNNNIGNNIKSWNRYKGTDNHLSEAISQMVNTNATPFIYNLADSRYIYNKTFDNRLQINIPFSAKIKFRTDIALANDKINQQENEFINLLSDSQFIQRKVIANKIASFQSVKLSERVNWSINKKTALNLDFMLNTDKSFKSFNNEMLQNDSGYTNKNSVKNNWRVLQMNGDYTFRSNIKKAFELRWQYQHLQLPQFIEGHSPFLFKSFTVPDSSYNNIALSANNLLKSLQVKMAFYLKKGKSKSSYHILYNQKILNRNSSLNIHQLNNNLNAIQIEDLSGSGEYRIQELYTNFTKGFQFLKLPFVTHLELGIVKQSRKEIVFQKKIQPRIFLSLQQRKNYSKALEGEVELAYKQSPPDIFKLNTKMYPYDLLHFKSRQNIFMPERLFNTSYRINVNFKNHSFFNSTLQYQKSFTSYMTRPVHHILYSTSIDSALHHPAEWIAAINSYSFPVLLLGAKINLNNSISRNSLQAGIGNRVNRMAFFSISNSVEALRNWNKKTFIQIKYSYQTSKNILTKRESHSYLGKTINETALLNLKQKLGKSAVATIQVEWVKNEASGLKDASGLFGDFSFKKEFSKSKIGIALTIENISNQKRYRVYNSYTPVYQSLISVPMVPRNAQISLNWSF